MNMPLVGDGTNSPSPPRGAEPIAAHIVSTSKTPDHFGFSDLIVFVRSRMRDEGEGDEDQCWQCPPESTAGGTRTHA